MHQALQAAFWVHFQTCIAYTSLPGLRDPFFLSLYSEHSIALSKDSVGYEMKMNRHELVLELM
jgi:hypothetical protein